MNITEHSLVGSVVNDDTSGRWIVARRWTHDKHVDFLLIEQFSGRQMDCRVNRNSLTTLIEEALQDK